MLSDLIFFSYFVFGQGVKALGVKVFEFYAFLEDGRANPVEPQPPSPSDLCTIMYTSGTTGDPKVGCLKLLCLKDVEGHFTKIPFNQVDNYACVLGKQRPIMTETKKAKEEIYSSSEKCPCWKASFEC